MPAPRHSVLCSVARVRVLGLAALVLLGTAGRAAHHLSSSCPMPRLSRQIKRHFTKDELAQLKALFMHVDEDGSKHLDAQETTTILRALGWRTSHDHIEFMINEVDLDGRHDRLQGAVAPRGRAARRSTTAARWPSWGDACMRASPPRSSQSCGAPRTR